jgi:hypothetical protein
MQAADAALPEVALGEAVVDRRPDVRADGAGVDLAADPAADVYVGRNPFTVDPVLGDLTHVRAPSAVRERCLLMIQVEDLMT